jgi:hypothetical protein
MRGKWKELVNGRVRVCTQLYVAAPTDVDKSMTSDTHRALQTRTNECRVIHCLGIECRLSAGHTKVGTHLQRYGVTDATDTMLSYELNFHPAVAYPGILFGRGRGGSTNSAEDRGQRERGSGGGSPLLRGSGGSSNLVQEISFHIVNSS